MEPSFIQFKKENKDNSHVTFEDKMKPRINFYDGFTKEEYEKILNRKSEIEMLIKDAVYEYFLNENSEESFCFTDGNFPDRRILSGHYYIGSESYGKAIRDENFYYKKKGGKYQALSSRDGIHYPFFEGDINTLKCYYRIIISVRLTSLGNGVEDDYLGIDFRLEFENIDDKIQLEILSTDVI